MSVLTPTPVWDALRMLVTYCPTFMFGTLPVGESLVQVWSMPCTLFCVNIDHGGGGYQSIIPHIFWEVGQVSANGWAT